MTIYDSNFVVKNVITIAIQSVVNKWVNNLQNAEELQNNGYCILSIH